MQVRTLRGVLRIESTPIEVTSLGGDPDEQWRYTDRHGHGHYYADGYPTLTRVSDGRYWCADCHDEHEDSHWECPLCHEEIRPGVNAADTFRRYTQGPVEYYLDDAPITEERYRELRTEMRVGPPTGDPR